MTLALEPRPKSGLDCLIYATLARCVESALPRVVGVTGFGISGSGFYVRNECSTEVDTWLRDMEGPISVINSK